MATAATTAVISPPRCRFPSTSSSTASSLVSLRSRRHHSRSASSVRGATAQQTAAIHPHQLSAHLRTHYRIGACLGGGGTGVVWCAERLHDRLPCAIKVMPRSLIPRNRLVRDSAAPTGSGGAGSRQQQPQSAKTFLIPMEAYILRRLQHNNIISFVEYTHDDHHVYLVTELHGGISPALMFPLSSSTGPPVAPLSSTTTCDLFAYIEQHGAMPTDKCRRVFNQLVQACLYLRSMNVWHMDLKDENVLVDSRTLAIKLVDFGSANIIAPAEVAARKCNVFFGTLEYAPPEIRLRHESFWVEKAEVWGLGVLLHTMVYGRPPPTDCQQQQVKKGPLFDSAEAVWARVALQGCLAPRDDDRWSLDRLAVHMAAD